MWDYIKIVKTIVAPPSCTDRDIHEVEDSGILVPTTVGYMEAPAGSRIIFDPHSGVPIGWITPRPPNVLVRMWKHRRKKIQIMGVWFFLISIIGAIPAGIYLWNFITPIIMIIAGIGGGGLLMNNSSIVERCTDNVL